MNPIATQDSAPMERVKRFTDKPNSSKTWQLIARSRQAKACQLETAQADNPIKRAMSRKYGQGFSPTGKQQSKGWNLCQGKKAEMISRRQMKRENRVRGLLLESQAEAWQTHMAESILAGLTLDTGNVRCNCTDQRTGLRPCWPHALLSRVFKRATRDELPEHEGNHLDPHCSRCCGSPCRNSPQASYLDTGRADWGWHQKPKF